MRILRISMVVLSAAVVCILGASVVQAVPVTTGSIVWDGSDLPDDLTVDDYESNSTIWLWHESKVMLTEDLRVNFGGDKTVGGYPYISAGTEICSFLLHYDRANDSSLVKRSGTVTFDGEILGLIFRDQRLIDTDALLGQSETKYWSGGSADTWRGLELPNEDSYSVNGTALVLDVDLKVENWMDEMRVLTVARTCATPDGGSTLVLLGIALSVFGARRRG